MKSILDFSEAELAEWVTKLRSKREKILNDAKIAAAPKQSISGARGRGRKRTIDPILAAFLADDESTGQNEEVEESDVLKDFLS